GRGNLLGLDARLFVGGRLALRVVQTPRAYAGILADAGRLAAPIAQIIELGTPHLAAPDHLDPLDRRRMHGEDALDALAVGNFADGEILLEPGTGARDAHALVSLDTRARTLGDPHQN